MATGRLNFSKAKYSLQSELNSNYLQQVYGMEMTNYMPWDLVLNNNFNYTINTGRADGYNTNVPFWNASMAKGFLKNKRAEFKICFSGVRFPGFRRANPTSMEIGKYHERVKITVAFLRAKIGDYRLQSTKIWLIKYSRYQLSQRLPAFTIVLRAEFVENLALKRVANRIRFNLTFAQRENVACCITMKLSRFQQRFLSRFGLGNIETQRML